MINLDEALDLVSKHAEQMPFLGQERVVLSSARGRVLAEDVRSAVDLPAADYSAMDGYAVSFSDFTSGQAWVLPLAGQSQTGHVSPALHAGTCVRIFTGAHIPDGADCVVMQENTEREGERVKFLRAPVLGENIRRRGEDVTKGTQILQKGTRLVPHQLGLLASAERTEVLVVRKPRVAILCTGDELRPPGSTLYGGQLAESNSIALAALCQDAGAEVTVCPLVRDEVATISEELRLAVRYADVVLTVGGVSVGDHDLVRPSIEAIGGTVIFHKVAIKPGKPVLFAQVESTLILGLPGNPASAQVVFRLLGVPLLRTRALEASARLPVRTGLMAHDFVHRPGRRSFYRVRLDGDQVTVLSNQASGATTSMAWANALLEMREDVEVARQGERVCVWPFTDC